MGLLGKIKRALELEPRRRRGTRKGKGRQSKRGMPPRNKNGRFRSR